MWVFVFEGPYDMVPFESLEQAEGHVEAVDVENDEYVFFAEDGTVVRPSVRDQRVVLTLTGEDRSEDFRGRLSVYLAHPGVAMNPALAADPAALAVLLTERARARRWPRWPARWRLPGLSR